MDLIELSSSADKAWVAISVDANSVVGLKRIRATSRATLPLNLNDSYVREILRNAFTRIHLVQKKELSYEFLITPLKKKRGFANHIL